MMRVRYLIAVLLGVVITSGLFFLMQSLIKLGQVNLEDDRALRVSDFVRLKQESEVITKKRELPQKQKIQKQPAPPSMKLPSAGGGTGVQKIEVEAPAPPPVEHSVKLAGGPHLGKAPSDAGTVPLVRIQPMYPRRAAEKRIEGWVLLKFDISETGAVINAKVLRSAPPRIFDRAALKAIRRWKYKPTIRNGVPVITRGIEVKLTFKLENE